MVLVGCGLVLSCGCVEAHLRAEFAKLGSPNKLTISPLHGGQ